MTKLLPPISILQKLTCLKCKHNLSIFPVYTNIDGSGGICGRCNAPDDGKSIRDEAYENIAQFLIFPCCNKVNGCEESLTPHPLEEHEKICSYRKLDCPTKNFSKCQWLGPHVDFVKHFQDKHSNQLIKDSKFVLELASAYKDNALLPFGDELFIVTREVDSRDEKLTCSVQQLQTGKNPERYKYFLRILSGDNTYSCKLSEKSTSGFDNTTKVDGDYMRDKLNNPSSMVVNIEILKVNEKDLANSDVVVEVYKDPKINWEVLRELECPICLEYMLSPIYQCVDGHSICYNCKPKITECPLCKKRINDTKNFSLEKITQHFIFPCKYYKMGCTYSCLSAELLKHEGSCVYGPYKCPLNDMGENCQWKSNSSQIVEHVTKNHDAVILKSDRVNVPFKKDEDKEAFHLIAFFEKMFRLHYKYENGKFFWSVQLVGPPEECKKFKVEIDVVDHSRNKLRRYAKGLCAPLAETANSFNDSLNYLTMGLAEVEPLFTTTFSYRVRILRE